jgi:hypothetical protein
MIRCGSGERTSSPRLMLQQLAARHVQIKHSNSGVPSWVRCSAEACDSEADHDRDSGLRRTARVAGLRGRRAGAQTHEAGRAGDGHACLSIGRPTRAGGLANSNQASSFFLYLVKALRAETRRSPFPCVEIQIQTHTGSVEKRRACLCLAPGI